MSDGPEPPATLAFETVSVRYGDRIAVQRVSLAAHSGEVVALAGPNGSGKSTLLRAAAGLLDPYEGVVRLGDGAPATALSARERACRLAWMPQEEPAGENVPLGEYVGYGRYAHLSRWVGPTSRDRSAVQEALREVDLAGADRRGVRELSGGERQRARLARALAQETPLILLDEPTAHLDIGHQLDVLERVRGIARRSRRAVVVALHDLNLAARYADRVAVLSRGHLVAEGLPAEVLSADLMERVWGVLAEVRRDRTTGLPFLLPRLPGTPPAHEGPASSRQRVHVVAGGGSGAELLRGLVDAGYDVSAGVLPLFDTDSSAAQDLGIRAAVEVPFAPIGSEALARLDQLLGEAQAVVLAAFPVGPSNLANLEHLLPWVGRRPVAMLSQSAGQRWDFTDGRATELRERLLAQGGVEVASLQRLREWLEQPSARPPPAGGPGERHQLDP